MRYGWLLIALLAVPGWAAAQTSAKPVELKWKFKEGEKFWVDTLTHIDQTERAGQAVVANAVQLRTIISYTVRKVSEGSFTELDAKVVKALYANSPTPDGERMAVLYGRLQGANFQIVLGPDYQVQRLDGYNQWLTKLGAVLNNPAEIDRIRTLLPEADIKNALAEGFGFLPEHAITPGQQWVKRTELNLAPAGSLTSQLTYTYKGHEKNREKITIATKDKGKFTGNLNSATPGVQTNFSLESRTGTLYFNAQTGKLEQAEHAFQTQGTILVPATPSSPPLNVIVLNRVVVKQTVTSNPPTR